MCGISGEIRFDGRRPDIMAMSAMTGIMHRRGEDGEGMIAFDNVVLGHRRLKIFDLSSKAQQPMMDPELGLAITFNGAIYNYRVLRNDLEEKGYRFFSSSDTEVLLKSYHCYGIKMLEKLEGMFAFAIYERDSGKIVLVRDRMGVKPLFYTHSSTYFRFASTLPALLSTGVNKAIDKEALHYYLTFHAIPEPLTLVAGMRKLEPGTVMTVEPNGIVKKHRYWEVCFASEDANHTQTENEWMEELEMSLTHAIKARLIADVPVGILLSGGLDSSLLVALISKTTNQSPPTFSIGFESTDEEAGDEFYYSDMVAKEFNTSHHKLFVKMPEIRDALSECVTQMSEPMPSHDVIAFYLLSQEVAKHVKAVQSGQGADELFAGYHWFQNIAFPDTHTTQAASQIIYDTIADNTYGEYLRIVNPEYHTPNLAFAYMKQLCGKNHSHNPLDQLQQYESTVALTNGPLARVDNMTMAWGLEAREPFLDHRVVELASRLPSALKLKQGGKYLLRKLARKLLPVEVVDRAKGYFPVPKLKYLGQKELDWLKDILSPERIRRRGIFQPFYVDELFKNPSGYHTPLGASRLWQIGVLECWLQAHAVH